MRIKLQLSMIFLFSNLWRFFSLNGPRMWVGKRWSPHSEDSSLSTAQVPECKSTTMGFRFLDTRKPDLPLEQTFHCCFYVPGRTRFPEPSSSPEGSRSLSEHAEGRAEFTSLFPLCVLHKQNSFLSKQLRKQDTCYVWQITETPTGSGFFFGGSPRTHRPSIRGGAGLLPRLWLFHLMAKLFYRRFQWI